MKLSSQPRWHACPPSVSNTHHAPPRGAGASPKWPINGLFLPLVGLASTWLRAQNFAERRFGAVRVLGILRSSLPEIATGHTKIAHMEDAPSTSYLLP